MMSFCFLRLDVSANSRKAISFVNDVTIKRASVFSPSNNYRRSNEKKMTNARILYIILRSCTRTDWLYSFYGSDIPDAY